MPFNGTGLFSRLYQWTNDRANDLDVDADRMDTDSNDIAQGLSNCITRDGQSPAVANLPMGGKKLINLGAGSAASDSVNYGQVFASPTFVTPFANVSPSSSDNPLRLATVGMVNATAFSAALPAQPGGTTLYNLVSQNGAASWQQAPSVGIFDNQTRLAQVQATALSF